MTYKLIHDDIIKWASQYKGPKFHAAFMDPPYHLTSIVKRASKGEPEHTKTYRDMANRSTPHARQLAGFMGQTWDGGDIAFNPETWAAMGEHLYDGGFGMAFASSRGWHRLACAIEDAGFIIHPSIFGWCFLSGFPKATRIDTQVDKAAGVEVLHNKKISDNRAMSGGNYSRENNHSPATPLAQTWQSHRYGLQAMKPALEPIILFQKPYVGRPVDNITGTGAGALNIDGGRIATDELTGWGGNPSRGYSGGLDSFEENGRPAEGRWPANLILDEEGARLLDEQSGITSSKSSKFPGWRGKENKHEGWKRPAHENYPDIDGGYDDEGGASRMFFQSNWQYEILEQLENADPLRYEPKVSTAEREAGLNELPARTRNRVNSGGYEDDPKFAPTQMRNHHPTLKPISLTKYLTTLLLPPDAYAPRRILVPFAGTGSEMIGAILAGWDEVIGIERTAEYIPIAEARLKWWSQWPGWGQTDVDKILASLGNEPAPEQLGLFNSEEE